MRQRAALGIPLAAIMLMCTFGSRAHAEPLHTRFRLLAVSLQTPAALAPAAAPQPVSSAAGPERSPAPLPSLTVEQTEAEAQEHQVQLRGAMLSIGFGVGLTLPGLTYFALGTLLEAPPAMTAGAVLAGIGILLTTLGILKKRRVPAAARALNDHQISGAAAGIATILALVVIPGTMFMANFPTGS